MGVVGADHTGPWSVEDVLALPEDAGRRVELVGGSLLIGPAPEVPHRWAGLRLAMLLGAAIDADGEPQLFEVLESPRVAVPDGLLVPDLVLADTAAAAGSAATLDAGGVVVAIEIPSPSTRAVAKALKPSLYAAAGVPHYWRVELDPVPRLHLGRLQRGGYVNRVVQVGETTALDDPITLDIDPAALRR
ncbi:Uma2 family endonuclease [Kitasatospora sp. NPDC048365]|uniref:Uma2 family endonuclease n=1 Tax=Kitasatospora sp. NPDC048365 TaxID=3364050 RepID=UPI0037234D8F